jgi:probable HAF family extracellular repeat protein
MKAFVFAVVAAAGAASAAPRYSVLDVGAVAHPEARDSSYVIAFAGGQVVGSSRYSSGDTVYWIYDVASASAGDLPAGFEPVSANANGDLVGWFTRDDGTKAFVALSSAGDQTELSLPRGRNTGIRLNDNGLILGNTEDPQKATLAPFILGPDGVQDLLSAGANAQAVAMNNAGLVVGFSTEANGDKQAVIWQDGVFGELGTLGHRQSYAIALNDQGLVAGVLKGPPAPLCSVFLWSADGMRDLGAPEPGAYGCTPNSINSAGHIVGEARDGSDWDPHYHGWIWQDGTYTPLQSLIDSTDVTIESPVAIDDDGWIATAGRPFPVEGRSGRWARALLLKPLP